MKPTMPDRDTGSLAWHWIPIVMSTSQRGLMLHNRRAEPQGRSQSGARDNRRRRSPNDERSSRRQREKSKAGIAEKVRQVKPTK